MKYLFIALSFSISVSSFANVFCKDNSGVRNILQQDGWRCRDLLTEVDGAYNSCFTGKRTVAIELLNSLDSRGFFDGTDGITIVNAKYKGVDSIAFTVLDEANEESWSGSIGRCSRAFFEK